MLRTTIATFIGEEVLEEYPSLPDEYNTFEVSTSSVVIVWKEWTKTRQNFSLSLMLFSRNSEGEISLKSEKNYETIY
jgi:hypothetical protein